MIVSSLVVLFVLVSSVNAGCFTEDRLYGDLCYSFPKTRMTYIDARDYCHSINQNLAVIHTQLQNNFLSNDVRINSEISNPTFWIGLSRSSISSPFFWDDETPVGWTNFDPNLPKDSLYAIESTMNGKWSTLNGRQILDFVCSYNPNSTLSFTTKQTTTMQPTTTPTTTTVQPTTSTTTTPTPTPTTTQAATTITALKPSVTCLFMVDMQSAGIDQAAIETYQSYFNFAQLVAGKLNNQSGFTGFLDSFGYSGGLGDHQNYATDSYDVFSNIAFPIDGTDDSIDLELKDIHSSLATAQWTPPVNLQTCLIFFSNAPVAMYGENSIQPTYDSFTTVLGVLLGTETSIPGLTNLVAASTLSDAEADVVVQKLLESLHKIYR